MPRKKKTISPAPDVQITGSIGHGKKAMRNADLIVDGFLDRFNDQLIITKKPHMPEATQPGKRRKRPKSA